MEFTDLKWFELKYKEAVSGVGPSMRWIGGLFGDLIVGWIPGHPLRVYDIHAGILVQELRPPIVDGKSESGTVNGENCDMNIPPLILEEGRVIALALKFGRVALWRTEHLLQNSSKQKQKQYGFFSEVPYAVISYLTQDRSEPPTYVQMCRLPFRRFAVATNTSGVLVFSIETLQVQIVYR
jgi:hypothetical protein